MYDLDMTKSASGWETELDIPNAADPTICEAIWIQLWRLLLHHDRRCRQPKQQLQNN